MTQQIINRDTILDEIHQTRQQMADKFNGDITAILEDARKRQEASGRAVWQSSAEKEARPQGRQPSATVEA